MREPRFRTLALNELADLSANALKQREDRGVYLYLLREPRRVS